MHKYFLFSTRGVVWNEMANGRILICMGKTLKVHIDTGGKKCLMSEETNNLPNPKPEQKPTTSQRFQYHCKLPLHVLAIGKAAVNLKRNNKCESRYLSISLISVPCYRRPFRSTRTGHEDLCRRKLVAKDF